MHNYGGYGLNYSYLNDFVGDDPPSLYSYKWNGISQAGVNKPASIVMLMDMVGVDWANAAHTSVYVPINGMVDAPDNGRSGNRVAFASGWGGTCSDYTTYYSFPGYGGAAF